MSLTILTLVLVSAALHPLREMFIKGSLTPEGVSFAVVFLFGVSSAVHVALSGIDPWSAVKVWPLVVASGTLLIVYYFSVLSVLRHGDLSIYYPVTRSSPLFIVVVGFLFLGQTYSPVMLLGVALVLVGVFLLQYRPGAEFFSQPKTLGLAVLAMVAHGGITMVDAEAVRQVEPVAFLLLQYVIFTPIFAILFIVTRPKGRSVYRHLFNGWVETPFRFLFAGITAYASYYLMLMTFQMGANVAAVATVRQISIPLSVLMGGLILKEARMSGRLAWSALLAVGVVLIILSK